jgi:hypothetical protein
MRRCPECLSRAYEEVKPPKPAYSGLPSQLSAEQRAVLYEIGMAKDTADTIEPERNQLFEQQFADYTNGKKTFRKLGHIVRKAFLSRVVQVLLVVIGAGALYIYFWPRTLTPATARRLASRFAPLQLDYVKELTPATAGELSRHTYGELSLDGLRTLTLDVATALAQKRYGPLSLDGLSSISPDIARALANHERDLSLNGLQDISSEVAEALATLEGGLFLDGLKEVSPEVAMALAAHRGELSLQGVSTISNDVAEALADHANQHGAGYPYGLRLQSAVDEMVGKAAERAKGTEKPNRPEPESVRQLRENLEFEYRLQQSKGGIWPPLR